VLAVAAAFAEGATTIRDVTELRVKESNRLATVEQELRKLGVTAEETDHGLVVHGGAPHAATLESHGDHRIAMAAAVAANAIEGETQIRGWSSVAVSFPEFAETLDRLSA
jgi:3-phosphoshikimate 1-carboxyvinyltransferase